MGGGHLVGSMQFLGSADILGCCRFWRCGVAPCRIGIERRIRGGVRDGVCSADFRYHLERRDLVSRVASLQLSHVDRIHHGSWIGELVHGPGARFRRRGQLGKDSRGFFITVVFPDRRFCFLGPLAVGAEISLFENRSCTRLRFPGERHHGGFEGCWCSLAPA
jgi:hypothetical protein